MLASVASIRADARRSTRDQVAQDGLGELDQVDLAADLAAAGQVGRADQVAVLVVVVAAVAVGAVRVQQGRRQEAAAEARQVGLAARLGTVAPVARVALCQAAVVEEAVEEAAGAEASLPQSPSTRQLQRAAEKMATPSCKHPSDTLPESTISPWGVSRRAFSLNTRQNRSNGKTDHVTNTLPSCTSRVRVPSPALS